MLDVTFGNGGKVVTQLSNSFSRAFSVSIQPDQKILAAGDAVINNEFLFALTRYNADGVIDSSFGNGGKVFTSFGTMGSSARSMVLQPDGKIVLAGQIQINSSTNIHFGLARYNMNGIIDSSFGINGMVITNFGNGYNGIPKKIIIKPDGKFIVAGYRDSVASFTRQDFALVQYKADGLLDSTFGINGIVLTDIFQRNDQCYSLALLDDGKILAGGNSTRHNSAIANFAIVRYETSGIVDSSFGINGHVFSNIDSSICRGSSLLIRQDGVIILAGDINNINREDFGMVAFTPDGIPASSFGINGKVVTPMSKSNDATNYINAALLQPDGKILLAGVASTAYNNGDFVLLRYNEDGTLDNTFGKRGIIKTDFANTQDYCTSLGMQEDGKIVLAGYAASDLALARYDKNTQAYYNTLNGSVFLDKNANGMKDPDESFFVNANISTIKEGVDTIITNTSDGKFSTDIDTGTYVTAAIPYLPYYTVIPASHTTINTDYFNTDSISFAVQPLAGKRDLAISMIPLTAARPGFPVQYKLVYRNQGTDTVSNGMVELIKNSRLNFDSASPVITSAVGDTLQWNFTNLKPSEVRVIIIYLSVQLPPAVYIGDTLKSTAIVSSATPDLTPKDNISSLVHRVVGSYDPNDKIENHGGLINQSQVMDGEFLQYTIRFQNTGTDTAFNVFIRDTLSEKLDWPSFEMILSSHNYQLTIHDGGVCSWDFININLADSNTNEPLSHGYLVYRIKLKTAVVATDTAYNSAAIYFDYNLPVATNRAYTAIVSEALPLTLVNFIAKKEDRVNLLLWSTAQEKNVDYFEIQRSANSLRYETLGKITPGLLNYSFTDNNPLTPINYYRLKMADKDGLISYSVVRAIDNTKNVSALVYPNPVKNKLTISLQAEHNQDILLQLISSDGKVILSNRTAIYKGTNLKLLNVAALHPGNYSLQIISADKEYTVLTFNKL